MLISNTPEENEKNEKFFHDVADKNIENKLLEILDAFDSPVGSDLVEECCRKDAGQVLLNNKKLKELKQSPSTCQLV